VSAKRTNYNCKSKVFRWPGEAAWYFVAVETKASGEIKENFGKHAKGFRSIPVAVTVGKTSWNTSLFPDKKSGQYLLPLKAQIRKQEDIWPDDMLEFSIKIKM